MAVSVETRKAYAEIDEFLGLLSPEEQNAIPKKLRDFFKEEKDANYIKNISPNIPIKEQNLMEETLAIIAFLNLQYWCKDEAEKKKLKQQYAENDKKEQESIRQQYNPEEIFKKKEKKAIEEQLGIVVYKESIWKKLANRIRRFFKRKER